MMAEGLSYCLRRIFGLPAATGARRTFAERCSLSRAAVKNSTRDAQRSSRTMPLENASSAYGEPVTLRDFAVNFALTC